MTIIEFLEARIAEDEAVATRQPGFYPHQSHGTDAVGSFNPGCPECMSMVTRDRLTKECAAKRVIIGVHHEYAGICSHCVDAFSVHQREVWPCSTIRALASVYANHQGYQQEWAV